MPGYVIASIDVHDEEGFAEYRRIVPPSIEAYGGRFLVRTDDWERLEGDWDAKRLAVLEFPRVEDARRWYDSDEYREALALRLRVDTSDLLIVDGIG